MPTLNLRVLARTALVAALCLAGGPSVAVSALVAGAPSEPAAACSVAAPSPDKPTLCQRSYCADEGVRCVFTATGPGGCCRYDACQIDLTCIAPDPLPINICR